ncbi:hypothetical protein [Sorangium sp. So ce117]|uniref:hypothetical protein n=1 Tax=Sorangium sp. So ce117 TaxID=3133277 RepID=UPI003F61827C
MGKLDDLMERTWQSHVFGDSYPTAVGRRALSERMRAVHACFLERFRPIVQGALPDLDPEHVERVVRRIGPKATAFCAAIAIEIEEVERLAEVSIVFGLLFLFDGLMDDGDLAMVAATHRFIEVHAPRLHVPASNDAEQLASAVLRSELDAARAPRPDPALVAARARPLAEVARLLRRLSSPEGAGALIESPVAGFLSHGSAMRQLSQRYLEREEGAFWDDHADDFVAHAIGSIQTAGTVAVVYSLYRSASPELPTIRQVLASPAIRRVCERFADAASRIFDDVGDQDVDRRTGPRGRFDLNLFNHPNRRLVEATLRFVGVDDEDVIAATLRDLAADDSAGDGRVVERFVDVVRVGVASLPAECWRDAGVFLMLLKRIIESGYVNTLGDAALAE